MYPKNITLLYKYKLRLCFVRICFGSVNQKLIPVRYPEFTTKANNRITLARPESNKAKVNPSLIRLAVAANGVLGTNWGDCIQSQRQKLARLRQILIRAWLPYIGTAGTTKLLIAFLYGTKLDRFEVINSLFPVKWQLCNYSGGVKLIVFGFRKRLN